MTVTVNVPASSGGAPTIVVQPNASGGSSPQVPWGYLDSDAVFATAPSVRVRARSLT